MMAPEPPVTSPDSLADALAALADQDGWRPLAGGTDLLVQLNDRLATPPDRILDLWRLNELRGIDLANDRLVLGALTTYTDLRQSEVIAEVMPTLSAISRTIGAAQIQNRGTLGGNLANASPAGDTLPFWLAADAEIVAVSGRGERRIPAGDFFVAYRQTALARDELIARIEVPLVPRRQYRFRKVGTRRAQAISKVVMVVSWLPGDHGTWNSVRVALGSVAAVPIRAAETERALEGAELSPAVASDAVDALVNEIQPIDDVRSTADYRRLVAGRVLARILREAGGW